MDERDRGSLEDMLTYARKAVRGAQGRTRRDLDEDEFFALALQRLVEILGEAARRVSPETQEQYPVIPWRDIIGMRNRLIHGYDVADPDILWRTIKDDLPELIARLEELLSRPAP